MDDKTLVCRDCGSEFLFSVGEQEFFAQKGYTNAPTRCPTCRQQRRPSTGAAPRRPAGEAPRREYFPATCATCGASTQVPFRPTQGKPVYCSNCFRGRT